MADIPPEMEHLTERVLSSQSISPLKFFSVWRASSGFIREAAARHCDALRRERMSLDEYLWIHGLMVREILSMDEEDDRKAALEEALTRLAHLKSSTTVVRHGDFEPEIYRVGLNHYYEGERRLDIAMTAGFQSPPLLIGIIDVLAANHTSPGGSQASSSPNP